MKTLIVSAALGIAASLVPHVLVFWVVSIGCVAAVTFFSSREALWQRERGRAVLSEFNVDGER